MFVFPKLIEQKKSRYNGTIKVYRLFNHYYLSVNNLTQSGGLMRPIWHQALKKAVDSKLKVTNCLILGLGGGTVAVLVSKIWPQASIIGVDIDPVMVELGKKYLQLDKIAHLKVVIADAFKLNKLSSLVTNRYDLVLVDTYHGSKFPHQANTLKFINTVSSLLTPNGLAIFNRLNWAKNNQDISDFITSLNSIFSWLSSQKVLSNTLVYCSHVKLAR